MNHGIMEPSHMPEPLHSSFSGNGILLALDGRCIDRPVLPRALEICRGPGQRLDILLLNPPKPATLLLGDFLQQLEAAGIEYRLSSSIGDLAVELPRYVRRYSHIACVVLDCLGKWKTRLSPMLRKLRHEGYMVVTLLDREQKAPLADTEEGVST
jgi:hypothetical protein